MSLPPGYRVYAETGRGWTSFRWRYKDDVEIILSRSYDTGEEAYAAAWEFYREQSAASTVFFREKDGFNAYLTEREPGWTVAEVIDPHGKQCSTHRTSTKSAPMWAAMMLNWFAEAAA